MNFTKYSKYFVLSLITALVSVSFWIAFYTNLPGKLGFPNTTLETIFANYDGPNYMVIAKCGYVKNCISTQFSLPQPLEYYPAHFPGFPLLIKLFSFATSTPKAMLIVSLLGSILLTLTSYHIYKKYLKPELAFYLSLFLIFFPGRLLVLRIVGAPETLFIGFSLLSIIFFQNKKYYFSAFSAAAAMFLKSPGVLLFAAYFCMAIFDYLKNKNFKELFNKYFIYLIGPLTVLVTFYYYFLETGDFFAYFHSGDNFHLSILPFTVFISNHTWINTIWLEDIIYIFLLTFFGLKHLFKKFKFNIIFVYPFIYTLASIFVAHRDISRYIAPVYPFLILAFAKVLSRKFNQKLFLILLPAIILYCINFIIGNVAPISDWTPYL